ncbi:tetratricopeptide repeat protein [Treponema endosymbiont of Eucomonympha sp.]|uniref:tetratricopeptide repeat protein n=1 Tax=Treponema endosymbiont of Eucomonympha sp. TaxID=1580831 RepID=UPI0007509738|nr:tetratricopeptide repeat protein [Treponema endosymbiont of Eucomonympha sp.]
MIKKGNYDKAIADYDEAIRLKPDIAETSNSQAPQSTPREVIFFDGQIFGAYVSAVVLIKSAKKSIVLVDKYIDESVLIILSK